MSKGPIVCTCYNVCKLNQVVHLIYITRDVCNNSVMCLCLRQREDVQAIIDAFENVEQYQL